jgi:hypothetical protein
LTQIQPPASPSPTSSAYLFRKEGDAWVEQRASSRRRVVVPVKPDSYTLYTVTHPSEPPLAHSFGTLDADGRAQASFQLPASAFPSLAGTTLHHAFVVIDPATAAVRSTSNALALALVP